MNDIMLEMYHLIGKRLPILPLCYTAQQALLEELTDKQKILFEAYQRECFYNTEAERQQLFSYLVSVGLHIP